MTKTTPPPLPDKCCGTCAAVFGSPGSEQGECRFGPPIPFLIGAKPIGGVVMTSGKSAPAQPIFTSAYPPVAIRDPGCLQWRPNRPTPQGNTEPDIRDMDDL